MLVASANAGAIMYTTVGGLGYTSGFSGGGLVLDSTSGTNGASGTLTFVPTTTFSPGFAPPSNINFGEFNLDCNSCTNQSGGAGVTFGSFTFDLYVYDASDGAVGEWVGTAAGGTVYNDSSAIGMTIYWQPQPTPTQLGPGTSGAVTGNFGTTYFNVAGDTPIVSPNTNGGVTTIQGTINLATDNVPEPATMAIAGGLFIGLATLARKRRA